MKQMHTAMRNIGTGTAAAFAAALLALAAAGQALASQQFVSLSVQGPVDTREGVRGADETEPILLSAHVPGTEMAELWIDDTMVDSVEETGPDGTVYDRCYEWTYPADEDPSTVHVLTLRKNGGEPLYTARFGGKQIYSHSAASGVWYGWLAQWNKWNRFVDLQFEGDYEKAGNGFAANGWRMYDAYVAAIDPSATDANIRILMDRYSPAGIRGGARDADDQDQVFIWCDGSITSEETGSRRYILEAADSLVPDAEGNGPVWTPVAELPDGARTFSVDEASAFGRFLRVRVELP
jgi:hypothetical protein